MNWIDQIYTRTKNTADANDFPYWNDDGTTLAEMNVAILSHWIEAIGLLFVYPKLLFWQIVKMLPISIYKTESYVMVWLAKEVNESCASIRFSVEAPTTVGGLTVTVGSGDGDRAVAILFGILPLFSASLVIDNILPPRWVEAIRKFANRRHKYNYLSALSSGITLSAYDSQFIFRWEFVAVRESNNPGWNGSLYIWELLFGELNYDSQLVDTWLIDWEHDGKIWPLTVDLVIRSARYSRIPFSPWRVECIDIKSVNDEIVADQFYEGGCPCRHDSQSVNAAIASFIK